MPLDGTLIAPAADACLLPRSASAYMRAVSAAMRMPPEVIAAIERVADIKRDVSDAAIPFLVYEYGLEPVMPWLVNPRRALIDGRAWQRIRGTPAAIEMALTWRQAPLVRVEDDASDTWWDLFQLELSRCANARDDLAAMIALARLSKASHTDVIRIYNAPADDRVLEFNGDGAINGDGLFNDWSGAWLRPDWPKIALRDSVRHAMSLSSMRRVASTARERRGHRVTLLPTFRINEDDINGGVNLRTSPAGSATRERLGARLIMADHDRIPDGEIPDLPFGSGDWIATSALARERIPARVRLPALRLGCGVRETLRDAISPAGMIPDGDIPDGEFGDALMV